MKTLGEIVNGMFVAWAKAPFDESGHLSQVCEDIALAVIAEHEARKIDVREASRLMTRVLRLADVGFEKDGCSGTTRHYVNEYLIPVMQREGLWVVKLPAPPKEEKK